MTSRLMAVLIGSVMGGALGTAVIVGQTTAYAQQPEAPTELKVASAQESSGAPDGFVAKMRRFADKTQIVERLNGDIDGWYPRLGGMTTGSGFAVGPGYRAHLFNDSVFVDVSAAMTMKHYKAVDAKAEWLQSRYRRVELWTNFRYQDFPQEDFFGLGLASSRAARTNYAIESKDVSALGIFHVTPWLRMGTELGYFSPSLTRGTDPTFPTTHAVFTDVEAPGLAAQPDFVHTTLFTEIDYRDVRGNPRSGGYYKASYGTWDDRALQQFDFRRLDGEAQQFIPLGTKTHVIATRVGVSYVNNETGDRVPFYFLPYVGGSHTIRSFEEFRFTDENTLFLNAEYRWAVMKQLEIALFYDAGKVSRDWEQINLSDMKTGYGIGFRAATRKRVFARLDIGMGGGEGRQIFFKLGPSF